MAFLSVRGWTKHVTIELGGSSADVRVVGGFYAHAVFWDHRRGEAFERGGVIRRARVSRSRGAATVVHANLDITTGAIDELRFDTCRAQASDLAS